MFRIYARIMEMWDSLTQKYGKVLKAAGIAAVLLLCAVMAVVEVGRLIGRV